MIYYTILYYIMLYFTTISLYQIGESISSLRFLLKIKTEDPKNLKGWMKMNPE